jgi:hypothetical protein
MNIAGFLANILQFAAPYSTYPGGNPVNVGAVLNAQPNFIYGCTLPDTLKGPVSLGVLPFVANVEQLLSTMEIGGAGLADNNPNMTWLWNTNVVNSPTQGGHVIIPAVAPGQIGYWGFVYGMCEVIADQTTIVSIRIGLEGNTKDYGATVAANTNVTLWCFCPEFGTTEQLDSQMQLLITSTVTCNLAIFNPQQGYFYFGHCGIVQPST